MVLEHHARIEVRPLMASLAVDVLRVKWSTIHATCVDQCDFLRSFGLRDEVVDMIIYCPSAVQFKNVDD